MELFDNYFNTYRNKSKEIHHKYYHSYDVLNVGKMIKNGLHADERINYLIDCACMFHDIARFKQWNEFHTYIDANSFDHGDMGVVILKETGIINQLDLTEFEKDIVLSAVKYHNKMKVPNFDDVKLMVVNTVRDADKIVILNELIENKLTSEYDDISTINYDLVDEILKGNVIKNDLVKSDYDRTLRAVAWVNDLHYKESYQLLFKNEIMDKLLDRLTTSENYEETKFNELKNYINKFREVD